MNRGAFVAFGTLPMFAIPVAAADVVPGGTAFVENRAHFDEAAFAAKVGRAATIRQVYENIAYRPGVLDNIKNSLNGLQFGFGIDPSRIAIATANHGPSSAYTFSDYVWSKYRIGEYFPILDQDGKPITRNLNLRRTSAVSGPSDPNLPTSPFQDTSIQALQQRGVIFMTCHTAVEEIAAGLVKRQFAPAGLAPSAVAADILTHLIDGALVVPSMVATIAIVQQRYGYTYITIQS
jgi:intracellular sulfur oxidation DsrE/DsrF family protein